MTATRYVERFGVELEGGWDNSPPASDRLRRDTSVTNCAGESYVGECTSRPFRILDEGLLWIEENYPQHRSTSCGLHVHMSFDPHLLCVSYLADSDAYWLALKGDLESWAKQRNVKRRDFYSRLRGENNYCATGGQWVDADRALKGDGYDLERYRAVNFAALNKHGTIEIRVLPMFSSAKLAVGAVSTVLTATDNYLSACFADDALNAPVEEGTSGPQLVGESIIIEPFDPFAEGEAF